MLPNAISRVEIIASKSGFGGIKTSVSASSFVDGEEQSNPQLDAVASQISSYLQKNYELYPQKADNNDVEYNNFRIVLDIYPNGKVDGKNV